MQQKYRVGLCAALLALAACSRGPGGTPAQQAARPAEHEKAELPRVVKAAGAKPAAEAEEGHEEKAADVVALSAAQIQAAGIEVGAVRTNFSGAIDAPAVIAAEPQRSAIVASSVGGRVVEVNKNLGDPVARGATLAVIESREAAQFGADATIARRQRELAEATFKREERLYTEKVSSRQEYEVARSAFMEAQTRQQLAEHQVASLGGNAGQSSRLHIRAPIKGIVTGKQIARGDMIQAGAKLFEVADLDLLTVELSLTPADAARVVVGAAVDVSAEQRTASGKLISLSRVVDPATRQVRALASLPNGQGKWRIGETVRASVTLSGANGGQVAIPRAAVQTIEDKPSVFVREKDGFSIRHVVLGEAAGAFVTVKSGLDGAERIATTNTYVLKAEHGKGAAGEDHD